MRWEAAPMLTRYLDGQVELDELVGPMTRTRSHSRARLLDRRLAVRGRCGTDVVRLGPDHVGELLHANER